MARTHERRGRRLTATEVGHREPERWECPSCGGAALAAFCAWCGERRPEDDFSLAHLAAETIETVFHLDSKLLISIRTLATRPGELTAAFAAGRRRRYLGPFQLFFVVNVLFFLVESVLPLRVLAVPLGAQVRNTPYARLARPLVEYRAHVQRVDFAELTERFDRHSSTVAKSLVIVMVPLFAGTLGLIARGRHRGFVEQLVFALHFYAFWLVWLTAVLGVASLTLLLLGRLHMESASLPLDPVLTVIEFMGFGLYLAMALRRVYDDRGAGLLGKTTILTVMTFVLLHVYRLISMVATLYVI
jgi:hypothetical protein